MLSEAKHLCGLYAERPLISRDSSEDLGMTMHNYGVSPKVAAIRTRIAPIRSWLRRFGSIAWSIPDCCWQSVNRCGTA